MCIRDSYNVSDSENSSEISTVSIIINPVNDAPYFITSYSDLPSAIENENFICPIEIFDIDNESASLSVTPLYLPDWLSFENLILEGTPDISLAEDLSIEITLSVSDNELSTTNNFVLNITAVNDAPLSFTQNAFTLEDESLEIELVGADSDNDINSLEFSIEEQPESGLVTINGSTATYVPSQNYNGFDSFTYKVNDGEFDSNISPVTLTVTSVNDAPFATSLDDIAVPTNSSIIFVYSHSFKNK